eukprot:8797212-Heterocapsa_arctica.AAC.1
MIARSSTDLDCELEVRRFVPLVVKESGVKEKLRRMDEIEGDPGPGCCHRRWAIDQMVVDICLNDR